MRGLLILMVLVLCGCAGLGETVPQEVAADTIGMVNQTSSIITNDMEPWVLGVIVLLAGWAIPSPTEMIRGLVNLFKLF